ncbi:hypothetical protein N7454_002361 [Penicillium verhagenii]|nr:hypothetical protein N7454_002361 [Penicillium verhagenii]
MPRPKKTKTEDLARIRNNQRNCRERRRAYVAELEQKVNYYEKQKVQCCTTLQDRAQTQQEVLETPCEPSSVNNGYRDQSLPDWVEHSSPDWEGASIRTQTPCLTRSREPPGQTTR